MSWMKVNRWNRWKVVELNLYEIERIGWEMNEMSEMNLRRVGVSVKVPIRKSLWEWVRMSLSNWVWNVPIRKSLSESPYQTECEMSLSESPYQTECEMSLSKCPYQNVHIKISILPFMIQIVVLLELGWASIQQPIIKSIILIDLNEHLKNLEDSLDRHRAWRHTKVI